MSAFRHVRYVAVAAAMLCGLAGIAQAQTVLVVDRTRVLAESQVGQSINQQLEQIRNQIQNELEGIGRPIQEEDQRLQVELQSLTQDAFQQRPDLIQRLETLNTQVEQYAMAEEQRAREFQATQEQAIQPVVAALNEIEQAIMAERSAALVLNAAAAYHVSPSVNITSDVVERLNQRMSTTTVTRVNLPAPQ